MSDKIKVFIASLGFSLGFGIMFLLLSLPIMGLSSIQSLKSIFSFVGGMILIIVGLILLDVLRVPVLSKYFRVFDYKVGVKGSYSYWSIFMSSIFVGLSFASGWAPCVGPVMLGVISLLSNQQNFFDALIILLFMSLGLMSSFVVISFIAILFGNVINKLNKISIALEKFMGIMFIFLGILIILSKFNFILSLGIGTDWLEKFNYQITSISILTIAVSYISGILLFLSPCTLPMVIPYLFYLTGINIKKQG